MVNEAFSFYNFFSSRAMFFSRVKGAGDVIEKKVRNAECGNSSAFQDCFLFLIV